MPTPRVYPAPPFMVTWPQYGPVANKCFPSRKSYLDQYLLTSSRSPRHSTTSCWWCLRSLPLLQKSRLFPEIDTIRAKRSSFNVSKTSRLWSTWTSIHTRAASWFHRYLPLLSYILSSSTIVTTRILNFFCGAMDTGIVSAYDRSSPNHQIFWYTRTASITRLFRAQLYYLYPGDLFHFQLIYGEQIITLCVLVIVVILLLKQDSYLSSLFCWTLREVSNHVNK